MKTGILLINLGTPDSNTTADVKKYLQEFLMDARVIDIAKPLRYLLVNGIIAPFRSRKSAKAYRSIWLKQGSPLRVYSERLCRKLKSELSNDVKIELGMRYGNPSIASALKKLLPCEKLIVLPLYPQYASSSSGTAIEAVFQALSNLNFIPEVHVVNHFYDYPHYLDAVATQIKSNCELNNIDHFIFSYHGLPVRQDQAVIKETGRLAHKLSYEKQCIHNSELLAEKLAIRKQHYTTAFQSRLGKLPWLAPDLIGVMQKLAKKKHQHIAVISPSFVCDCLETLEEIGIAAKETWHELSGGTLTLIPALNDSPASIACFNALLTEKLE